jgi:glycine dehydrogenase subunit 2
MWSIEDIDYWIAVLQQISDEAYENPDIVKTAPHNQAVHRPGPASLDEPENWAMTWRAHVRKKAAREKRSGKDHSPWRDVVRRTD